MLFSFVGLAAVGITQGIFHAIGFHMWDPFLALIRNFGKLWGLNEEPVLKLLELAESVVIL